MTAPSVLLDERTEQELQPCCEANHPQPCGEPATWIIHFILECGHHNRAYLSCDGHRRYCVEGSVRLLCRTCLGRVQYVMADRL